MDSNFKAPFKDSVLRIGFLLANWYSGATLLTLLLDRHPELTSNGEGFYHPFRKGDTICSCGKRLQDCGFYRQAAASMWNDGGYDYDERIFAITPTLFAHPKVAKIIDTTRFPGKWRKQVIQLLPNIRSKYNEFIATHTEFMKWALAITEASIYLDSTKSLRRAEIFLSEELYRSSPVILLTRHPLSWCASWLRKRGKANIENAIHNWKEYIRRAYLLNKRFPKAPFLIVRYEDLCNMPEKEIQRIETFLGLDHFPEILQTNRPIVNHILGNQMRFSFNGKVYSPKDRSKELSLEQMKLVIEECKPWLTMLGYQVQSSSSLGICKK